MGRVGAVIFVTVGAQMPFDRLVRTVDSWAGTRGRKDIFAQIGPTDWRPSHLHWQHFLTPTEFRARLSAASVVVAHAGMGSIISALQFGKPILVMPRRGDLLETRNDHQVATAERLGALAGVTVARDEEELQKKLEAIEELAGGAPISSTASESLIRAVRSFIQQAR